MDVSDRMWDGGWQDGHPQHDSQPLSPSQNVPSRSGKGSSINDVTAFRMGFKYFEMTEYKP